MNNICEGFDSRSNNEFIRFLTYSRRSCSEVQNCLYVALDQNYITTDEFKTDYNHCKRIRQIIDGLIRHLKANNHNPPGQRTTDQWTTGNGPRATGQRTTGNGQRVNGLTGERIS